MVPRTVLPSLIPVQLLHQSPDRDILEKDPLQEEPLFDNIRVYDDSARVRDAKHGTLASSIPGHSDYFFSLYQDALRSIESNQSTSKSLAPLLSPSVHPCFTHAPMSTNGVHVNSTPTEIKSSTSTAVGAANHFDFRLPTGYWERPLESHEHWYPRPEDKLDNFDGLVHSRHFLGPQSVFLSTEYLLHQKEKWRRPRTVYTDSQLEALERSYKKNKYLRGKERKELCKTLHLEERHVKVWYQNRRAKERSQIRHDKWIQKAKKSKNDSSDKALDNIRSRKKDKLKTV